jgi:hypothetical protein
MGYQRSDAKSEPTLFSKVMGSEHSTCGGTGRCCEDLLNDVLSCDSPYRSHEPIFRQTEWRFSFEEEINVPIYVQEEIQANNRSGDPASDRSITMRSGFNI